MENGNRKLNSKIITFINPINIRKLETSEFNKLNSDSDQKSLISDILRSYVYSLNGREN